MIALLNDNILDYVSDIEISHNVTSIIGILRQKEILEYRFANDYDLQQSNSPCMCLIS